MLTSDVNQELHLDADASNVLPRLSPDLGLHPAPTYARLENEINSSLRAKQLYFLPSITIAHVPKSLQQTKPRSKHCIETILQTFCKQHTPPIKRMQFLLDAARELHTLPSVPEINENFKRIGTSQPSTAYAPQIVLAACSMSVALNQHSKMWLDDCLKWSSDLLQRLYVWLIHYCTLPFVDKHRWSVQSHCVGAVIVLWTLHVLAHITPTAIEAAPWLSAVMVAIFTATHDRRADHLSKKGLPNSQGKKDFQEAAVFEEWSR